MAAEKDRIAPEESFWRDLSRRMDERTALSDLEERIEKQGRALGLARRLLSLRSAPGYEDFRKALEGIHLHAVREMVRSTGVDSWVRVLQGRAQAYEMVLGVMEKGEKHVEALEKGLSDLQNERDAIRRPARGAKR